MCSRRNYITRCLKVGPCYIIIIYIAGDYFQALRNIIAPAANETLWSFERDANVLIRFNDLC